MGGMQKAQTKKFPKQRHFLAVFFISFMWGVFGADRMYLGKWGTGIVKLITMGGFGIWVVVDLILIMAGTMRDKQGREMLQFAEYKTFAAKTVLIFAVCLGAFILLNGLVLIATVMQFLNGMQNGGGSDLINGLQGAGLSPDDIHGLGL
jgi:TM2 domain-containing membrane protein YozV